MENFNERPSPSSPHEEAEPHLEAGEGLDVTACSALLDLFLGWGILQVLKNRSDVKFSGSEPGVMSNRMVVMSMAYF